MGVCVCVSLKLVLLVSFSIQITDISLPFSLGAAAAETVKLHDAGSRMNKDR